MPTEVLYPASNSMAPFYSKWSSEWVSPRILDRGRGIFDFHLYNEFPSLRSLYTGYEANWGNESIWTSVTRVYWKYSIIAAAMYIAFILVGQRFMQGKKAYDLKVPLAVWNLFLAVFSFVGTVRLVPHLLYGLAINHHTYFFCRAASAAYGLGSSGLWVNLFIWSKYAELLDTVFLVLRKKPVSFLHWFHHATVLMYCWHASQYEMPTGIFFATMNYIVHSIMYFYYFLAAVMKPPKWSKFVTVLQIAQMFAGMFITAYHYYLLNHVPNCDGSYQNIAAAFVMYTAYMVLFVQFFVGRYIDSSKTARVSPSSSKSNKRRKVD